MSRIGKQPLPIPEKVKVEVGAREIKVTGPKGELSTPIPPGIACEQQDNELVFTRDSELPQARSYHGLARALAANAVKGVSQGFSRELDIVGVGFRAEEKGKSVKPEASATA